MSVAVAQDPVKGRISCGTDSHTERGGLADNLFNGPRGVDVRSRSPGAGVLRGVPVVSPVTQNVEDVQAIVEIDREASISVAVAHVPVYFAEYRGITSDTERRRRAGDASIARVESTSVAVAQVPVYFAA